MPEKFGRRRKRLMMNSDEDDDCPYEMEDSNDEFEKKKDYTHEVLTKSNSFSLRKKKGSRQLKVLEVGKCGYNFVYKIDCEGEEKWVSREYLYPNYARELCEFYEKVVVYR